MTSSVASVNGSLDATSRSPHERWVARARAEAGDSLGPAAQDAAITCFYARLYVGHPELFKWAGMAVFASTDIRRAASALRVAAPHLGATTAAMLDVLWRANQQVFEALAWAHVAYLAPRGGLEAVRRAVAGDPRFATIVAAFEQIDAGRALRLREPERARELVWSGNALLLRHEHERVLQPILGRLPPLALRVSSLLVGSTFTLGDDTPATRTLALFTPFMLLRGRDVLARTRRVLPDLADFAHRWTWLDRQSLPAWRRVDEGGAAGWASMRALAGSTSRGLP